MAMAREPSGDLQNTDGESTPLLARSTQVDEYYGFLNTEEVKARHRLASKSVFGEVKSFKRLRWVEWVFLLIATVTLLSLLGTAVERLVTIHNTFYNFTESFGGGDNTTVTCNDWTCLNEFILTVTLMANLGFCAFYCYDGVLRERPFEMIGYAVSMGVIMGYVIVDYSLEGNQGDIARLIRLVLVVLMGPQNIALAIVVQYRMGYLVLNTIGSNQSLTKAYHVRSLAVIMQRFNLQLLVNVLILSCSKGAHFLSLEEIIAIVLLIVYMIVVSYIGWSAVVWEVGLLSALWLILVLPCLGFYAYKIVNLAVYWKAYEVEYTEYYNNGNPPDVAYFTINASVIVILCGFGLVCVVGMCILMYLSMINFGKGLRDRLPPPCSNREGKP